MRFPLVAGGRRVCSNVTNLLCLSALLLGASTAAFAQTAAAPMPQHVMTAAEQNKQLVDQIAELRAQIAKLQAAVDAKSTTKAAPPPTMKGMAPSPKPAMPPGGMGMMDDKAQMGEMGKMGKKPEMTPMPAGNPAGMSPAPAMGMCCMGEMGGMGGMKPPAGGMAPMPPAPPMSSMPSMSKPTSAMPGQPGVSHLYHMGSTGFFLDHGQHITLAPSQKAALNRLKEKAMLDQAVQQRQIDQAEQELFILTGADQFDSGKVQAKIGEIEKLRAGQRMDFIRAVGEASNVLTHEQHLALLGTGGKS